MEGEDSPSHQARRTRFLRCIWSLELMVNQMWVMTPGPFTSRRVRDAPGSTGRKSALPPVVSQLEERWHLYSRMRAMAKRASGAGGGAVGAGGSTKFFLVCAVPSRPRSAPAAARVPIILRRVGAAVDSVATGFGALAGSMGGMAAPFSVIQKAVREDDSI